MPLLNRTTARCTYGCRIAIAKTGAVASAANDRWKPNFQFINSKDARCVCSNPSSLTMRVIVPPTTSTVLVPLESQGARVLHNLHNYAIIAIADVLAPHPHVLLLQQLAQAQCCRLTVTVVARNSATRAPTVFAVRVRCGWHAAAIAARKLRALQP